MWTITWDCLTPFIIYSIDKMFIFLDYTSQLFGKISFLFTRNWSNKRLGTLFASLLLINTALYSLHFIKRLWSRVTATLPKSVQKSGNFEFAFVKRRLELLHAIVKHIEIMLEFLDIYRFYVSIVILWVIYRTVISSKSVRRSLRKASYLLSKLIYYYLDKVIINDLDNITAKFFKNKSIKWTFCCCSVSYF